jgi:hypothetical protein
MVVASNIRYYMRKNKNKDNGWTHVCMYSRVRCGVKGFYGPTDRFVDSHVMSPLCGDSLPLHTRLKRGDMYICMYVGANSGKEMGKESTLTLTLERYPFKSCDIPNNQCIPLQFAK